MYGLQLYSKPIATGHSYSAVYSTKTRGTLWENLTHFNGYATPSSVDFFFQSFVDVASLQQQLASLTASSLSAGVASLQQQLASLTAVVESFQDNTWLQSFSSTQAPSLFTPSSTVEQLSIAAHFVSAYCRQWHTHWGHCLPMFRGC